MQIIELYEVGVLDGVDRVIPRFYFTDKVDADRYKSIPKNQHDSVFLKQFKVYTSFRDYQDNSDKAIRDRALAKLTPEEKMVLGLK